MSRKREGSPWGRVKWFFESFERLNLTYKKTRLADTRLNRITVMVAG